MTGEKKTRKKNLLAKNQEKETESNKCNLFLKMFGRGRNKREQVNKIEGLF